MQPTRHPDRFVDRHIGPDSRDIEEMLAVLGVRNLDELIDRTVPDGHPPAAGARPAGGPLRVRPAPGGLRDRGEEPGLPLLHRAWATTTRSPRR